MTSEQYDKLTDDEKRVKVAELCGWRPYESPCPTWRDIGGRWEKSGCLLSTVELPDYLNDLNAMHEALQTIPMRGSLRTIYFWNLVEHDLSDLERAWATHNATAAQRAKAFVLTMTERERKWTSSK